MYNEMTFQELKREAKRRGIEVSPKDTKDVVIAKLESDDKAKQERIDTKTKVNKKISKGIRCKVLANNPEEKRDSVMVIIGNEAGIRSYPVPLGLELTLPEEVVANLEQIKYQAYVKVNAGKMGMVDKPILEKAYTVIRL